MKNGNGSDFRLHIFGFCAGIAATFAAVWIHNLLLSDILPLEWEFTAWVIVFIVSMLYSVQKDNITAQCFWRGFLLGYITFCFLAISMLGYKLRHHVFPD